MEEVRPPRLAMARLSVLGARIDILETVLLESNALEALGSPLPHLADICSWPPIRDVLELPSASLVDKTSFLPLMASVPQMCDTWKDAFAAALLGKLPDARDWPSDSLNLAGIWFSHTPCSRRPMRHTEIMRHTWTSDLDAKADFYAQKPDSILKNATLDRYNTFPWFSRVEDICLDSAAWRMMCYIMSLCRKDIFTVTAQQMDELNARFLCVSCYKRGEECVTNWRGVVSPYAP